MDETGRVVMDGEAKALAENEDVKEFYLGVSAGPSCRQRKSFRGLLAYPVHQAPAQPGKITDFLLRTTPSRSQVLPAPQALALLSRPGPRPGRILPSICTGRLQPRLSAPG